MLKNDHKPERVNDRILSVVQNGQKIITKKDSWNYNYLVLDNEFFKILQSAILVLKYNHIIIKNIFSV